MRSLILVLFISFTALAQFNFFERDRDSRNRSEGQDFTPRASNSRNAIGEYFNGLLDQRERHRRSEQRARERNRAALDEGIDIKHENEYLYGICLHKAKKYIATQIRPDLDENAIEDNLLSLELTSHEEVQTMEEGICGAVNQIEGLYGSLDEVEGLTDNMEDIVDFVMRRSFRERVISEAKDIAKNCQEEEEAIHNIAMKAATKVYEDNKPLKGWRILQTFDDESSGFYAEILEELPNGKIMLAIRGTNELGDWSKANANYGYNQFVQADPDKIDHKEVMAALRPYIEDGREVIFTGHSLGGGLAQGYSYYTNRMIEELDLDLNLKKNMKTVTFGAFGGGQLMELINRNSPPPLLTEDNTFANENAYFSLNQTHYRYNGDPVSEIGYFPYGQRRTLYHDDSIDPEYKGMEAVENHMMPRFREWKRDGNRLSHAFPDDDADVKQNQDRIGLMFASLTNNDAEISFL